MRVVVTGATGNVGTSVLESLSREPAVDSVLGVARRLPDLDYPKVEWAQADVSCSSLAPLFEGADAVVHLAWLIQPSRSETTLVATNVAGSRRVFAAAAQAGVRTIVYASSLGAYSPGPKDRLVDESWPVDGIPTSFYSRHKAAVEHVLDSFESEHPGIRVVRLRPALVFKREAASEIRRLFAGPFMPGFVLRSSLVPLVPAVSGLRFQAVHSYDVADAYRLAILGEVRGAFNIAAEPVIEPDDLARMFAARKIPVSRKALRGFALATWKLRLQPTPPGWVDMGLLTPLLDTSRARAELGWQPRYSSIEALADLLDGLRSGDGMQTAPLSPATSGPLRIRELLTGVGRS